jgi:hypothetical protein
VRPQLFIQGQPAAEVVAGAEYLATFVEFCRDWPIFTCPGCSGPSHPPSLSSATAAHLALPAYWPSTRPGLRSAGLQFVGGDGAPQALTSCGCCGANSAAS